MTKEEALRKIQELQEYVKNIPEKSPKTQLEEEIQKILSLGNWSNKGLIKEYLKIDEEFIYFKLPPANKDWFFETMEIAKEICNIKEFHIFPIGDVKDYTLKLDWTLKQK